MTIETKRLAVAAFIASFAVGTMATASAPQQYSQAPGFYRFMLGKIEITALCDGTSPLPVDQLLTHISPQQVKDRLAREYLRAPVMTSTNAFLINTGEKLVLVDTGYGDFAGPAQGKVLTNLILAGYRPEQVDEIYLTHFHGDHVGGLVRGNTRQFTNALVRADERESDFWLSQTQKDQAPEPLKRFFEIAASALKPYQDAGRFKPFRGDMELTPGINAHGLSGHTMGHTAYWVESEGERLVVVGDLIHVASIQFAEPGVTIRFDTDPVRAAAARSEVLREASITHEWIASAHVAFPGMGHVRGAGAGFEFVPVNYQATP
jgi:glyoxylase-like metal-dependent hydrolase (beta-lactamase superfamily II)